jgi:hypothetical protein
VILKSDVGNLWTAPGPLEHRGGGLVGTFVHVHGWWRVGSV